MPVNTPRTMHVAMLILTPCLLTDIKPMLDCLQRLARQRSRCSAPANQSGRSALAYGFSSAAHFANAYRKKFGVTLREQWRAFVNVTARVSTENGVTERADPMPSFWTLLAGLPERIVLDVETEAWLAWRPRTVDRHARCCRPGRGAVAVGCLGAAGCIGSVGRLRA